MKNPFLMLKGTKPGNDKAVRQHQAMAQGYVVTDPATAVKTGQSYSKTGCVELPGHSRGKK